MIAWNEFMDKYYPAGDKKSTFHCVRLRRAATLVEVLKQCGDNLTRENVMKQAASLKGVEMPMLLPGIKINTSATDFYPIQSVQLPRFKGETFELFGDILSGEFERTVTLRLPVIAGRQPSLYKSPIGHTLPGGLFRVLRTESRSAMTQPTAPPFTASLVSGERALPAAAFAERIARAASGFAALGVRPGRLRRHPDAQRHRLPGGGLCGADARRLFRADQLALQGRGDRLHPRRLRRPRAGRPCRPAGADCRRLPAGSCRSPSRRRRRWRAPTASRPCRRTPYPGPTTTRRGLRGRRPMRARCSRRRSP